MVALTEDIQECGLSRGQVGAVVEILEPDVFEIEFSDIQGRTYASFAVKAHQLMVLHYEPIQNK